MDKRHKPSPIDISRLRVPADLASLADERAFEIFTREAGKGKGFKQCLGAVYLMALQAGTNTARNTSIEPRSW